MTAPVLAATGLGFSYGRWRPTRVFHDLDWSVAPGRTTMLLGPNGAGKTTLLKLLAGFERPSAGTIRVSGSSEQRALFEQVGWMPQDIQPARGLSVLEQVEFAAWVGGESRRRIQQLARDAVADVDLDDLRDVRTDRLSGGQLRRVGLAQALVRRAPVLLLDEPMAGLDPAQAANFREMLQRLDCAGGIVISTHQVSDLADDVDRVAVLVDGRMRFDGTVEEMRAHDSDGSGTPASLAAAFTALVGGGRH